MGSFEYASNIAKFAKEYFESHPWFGLNLKPKIEYAIWFKNPVSYNVACHIQSMTHGQHHALCEKSLQAFANYYSNIVEVPQSRAEDFKRGSIAGFCTWLTNYLVSDE